MCYSAVSLLNLCISHCLTLVCTKSSFQNRPWNKFIYLIWLNKSFTRLIGEIVCWSVGRSVGALATCYLLLLPSHYYRFCYFRLPSNSKCSLVCSHLLRFLFAAAAVAICFFGYQFKYIMLCTWTQKLDALGINISTNGSHVQARTHTHATLSQYVVIDLNQWIS